MNIETFSTTYWYIWLLTILLIVTLGIFNGIGLLFYHKRRQKFLDQSNQMNNSPTREASTISTIDINRQTSIPSTYRTDYRLSYLKSSIPTIHEIDETSPPSGSVLNDKSDMDLLLEEFQRQALKEHNSIRAMYFKSPLKLSESLNLYAQYWAEQCVKTNTIQPSSLEWRLQCNGETLGENIISVKSEEPFDGFDFTSLIMANGNQSNEVDCVLNELTTEVGFGRAYNQLNDNTQEQQWIGVAHYYPYRQLTTVQS